MSAIEQVMQELPPELQSEVLDFAQFLLSTKVKAHARSHKLKPTFDWADSLEDLDEQLTSVELQHQITQWRLDEL